VVDVPTDALLIKSKLLHGILHPGPVYEQRRAVRDAKKKGEKEKNKPVKRSGFPNKVNTEVLSYF
jgi:hypothetical protein